MSVLRLNFSFGCYREWRKRKHNESLEGGERELLCRWEGRSREIEAGGERGSRDGRGRGVCTASYSTFGYRVPGLTAMSLLIASDSEELWQAAYINTPTATAYVLVKFITPYSVLSQPRRRWML